MPLIFDDSFVLYDDERLKTALMAGERLPQPDYYIYLHQREAQL